MTIPGLGNVTKGDNQSYQSKHIPVRVLGGKKCIFVLDDYENDPDKGAFHTAITNFLALKKTALKKAEGSVFRYYKKSEKHRTSQGEKPLLIKSARDVWAHVRFGGEVSVSRRRYGDKGIYISLDCGCDWERDHGMQVVFKNGLRVNKIGPYNGHLTNSDASDDERLENVVYRG